MAALKPADNPKLVWQVLFFFLLALLLRILYLGTNFNSADNCQLAAQVVRHRGYLWMLKESFGVLINVIVKIFVGTLSACHITLTEFWWKLPIALIGSLQVPLTFLFLRKLHCSRSGALAGSAFMAILPIHVMWSRFLWGYDALGVFFVTLAMGSLVHFFQTRTLPSGLLASFSMSLYLTSHGYIVPFLPCFFFALLFLSPPENQPWPTRFVLSAKAALDGWLFLFPLLLAPLYAYPIYHTFWKKTRLGFYVLDHFSDFVGDVGWALFILMAITLVSLILRKRLRSDYAFFLALCGAAYLAPLFFGTPPGLTVVRDYMLMGIYFWVLSIFVVFDRLIQRWRVLSLAIITLCFLVTLWGTVETIFFRDQGWDPSSVTLGRGGRIPDPGTKAAGYLIQKYAPSSSTVLALHRSIEPPNLYYYFRRTRISFLDVTLEDSEKIFSKFRTTADIVICDSEQVPFVEKDSQWGLRIILFSENKPRLWIFSKDESSLPTLKADVSEFNKAFDREFSWKVSFW